MQITKTTYNDRPTSAISLSQALINSPEKLSPAIVHLAGREDNRFPLTFLSEGMNNTKEIRTIAYDYDVMVRQRKTRPLIKAASGTGVGFTTVQLTFPDRWFPKDYIITGPSGVQVRLLSDGTPDSGGFTYEAKIAGNNASETLQSADSAAGAIWGIMFAPVGVDFSTGNRSTTQAPATIRHYLTTIRKSYQLSRTASNAVANFEFVVKGGRKTNMWMDWEEYQHMLSFLEETESMLWYAKRNYDLKGTPTMYDENNQPVYVGPGLHEQIQTKDTYSFLSEQKLRDTIGDLFYGMTDGQNKVLTVYTGTGGKREFDNAMKKYINANEYTKFNDGKFVDGSGRNLALGSYFTTYRHVDGHTVNVVYLPYYDNGAPAQAARRHPVTGYSMESYRMTFVDMTRYDGENNVQMVSFKGAQMKKWVVAGSFIPKGYGDESNKLRATDQDGASCHYMKVNSVVLKRYDTSLQFTCDLA